MQVDAGPGSGVQVDAVAGEDPYEAYPLSVTDIRSKLFALGISKSRDSIQRYCREGTLQCVKLGMLRRYHATEASVDALIETLQNDAASSEGMQLHEAAGSGVQDGLQLPAPALLPDTARTNGPHEAASTGMQGDAAAHTGMHRDDSPSDAPNPARNGDRSERAIVSTPDQICASWPE
jgi:hypothetical protein